MWHWKAGKKTSRRYFETTYDCLNDAAMRLPINEIRLVTLSKIPVTRIEDWDDDNQYDITQYRHANYTALSKLTTRLNSKGLLEVDMTLFPQERNTQ